MLMIQGVCVCEYVCVNSSQCMYVCALVTLACATGMILLLHSCIFTQKWGDISHVPWSKSQRHAWGRNACRHMLVKTVGKERYTSYTSRNIFRVWGKKDRHSNMHTFHTLEKLWSHWWHDVTRFVSEKRYVRRLRAEWSWEPALTIELVFG